MLPSNPSQFSALRTELDAIAHDPRFAPFSGWHDDYPGISGPDYRPAIQQLRDEFVEFLSLVPDRDRCLQIGLGHAGGAHRMLEHVFRQVWTIDFDPSVVNGYYSRFGSGNILIGNSRDPDIISRAALYAPYDMLLIDGDHNYDGVKADWNNYHGLVRSGGIIGFHDAAQQCLEVRLLIDELRSNGHDMHMIGDEIGIAWIVKQ